jgi:kumamolisin
LRTIRRRLNERRVSRKIEEEAMADRKVFQDSVVPLPHEGVHAPLGLVVQSASAPNLAEPMTVHFSFAAPAQAELEARVAGGEVVSPEERAKYLPATADITTLKTWLEGEGFTINHVAADGIYAQAPASQVGKSLAVDMVRVTRDGFTRNAARTAPSLPADIANNVRAIGGLQPFLRANRHSRQRTPKAGNRISLGTPVLGLTAESVATHNAPPYLVGEVLKAYNADGLNVTGAGQTIAILIDTFPDDADLTAFWAANGLPAGLGRIQKINVKGGPLPPPEGEETLDVEWTSGIAPGANIRIYATGSLSFVDLDRALDQIIADLPSQPGMRQLSVSLGLGEVYLGGPDGEVATQHQKYLQLAAAGVNVFVSTGDAGSNPDQTGHGSGGPTQAEYASSDPSVVAVGGTTLVLSPTGAVASEAGWTNGGGGKSRFFARPIWQKGASVPQGTKRLVPDVSATADPDDGAFLLLAGKVVQIGGTSWSAPVWAGLCALINEARIKAGKAALPFLNPLIYPLAGKAAFRDITTGNNGQYDAQPGYDLVTGLGVPNVKELIAAIAT